MRNTCSVDYAFHSCGFYGRFPAPRNSGDARAAVIREIEDQATKSWGSNRRAIAAWDFMRVVIDGADETGPMDLGYADPVEGILYIRR